MPGNHDPAMPGNHTPTIDRWVSGEIEMLDLTGSQMHHHQEINGTKTKIVHYGEVTHVNLLRMILQKSRPGLSRGTPIFRKIFLDRPFGNPNP